MRASFSILRVRLGWTVTAVSTSIVTEYRLLVYCNEYERLYAPHEPLPVPAALSTTSQNTCGPLTGTLLNNELSGSLLHTTTPALPAHASSVVLTSRT